MRWVLLLLALGGCAAAPMCPSVKPYTAAEQSALASALGPLDPSSPIVGAIEDYGTLRAAAKACAKKGN